MYYILFIVLTITFFSDCLCIAHEKKTFTQLSLLNIHNQYRLTKLWSIAIGHGIAKYYSNLHPICQDTNIFIAHRDGIIKKIDINSGKTIWKIDLSFSIEGRKLSSSPILLSGGITFANDKIYIGSELAKVYAICAKTGAVIWKTEVMGEVLSSPVISNGSVLIHTSTGVFQALNECDGSIQWTVSFDVPLFSLRNKPSPVKFLDMVLLSHDDGTLSALLLNQGKLLWQQKITTVNELKQFFYLNSITTTPIIINDVVYAQSYNDSLVALDIYSGQIIWSLKDISSIKNMVAVNFVLYLIDQNDQIIAVNAHDGAILWKQDNLLYKELTVPGIYNNYIVIGDRKGYIYLIDINDGSIFLQQKICSSEILRSIIVENKCIIQLRKNRVYGFLL
ncbi:outer membrane protein assembly factor BamB [Blochmannia endosymbiont of Camponotus (Colobopsis) obliquus]|uniref:outer membrane protein assembly factor BamB n=1 Tax=Blochmannia endosymbiont of Camponotus (Colobopsis) obliquus TaxID=1505597 RepID=UPI000A3FD81D|nr:outer membrane protein assembly factor BamB [Blochmannia endosymbiont of Camponotus (Colobopsis) obliquus]